MCEKLKLRREIRKIDENEKISFNSPEMAGKSESLEAKLGLQKHEVQHSKK